MLRLPRAPAAIVGLAVVTIALVISLAGPLLAPHPPQEVVGGAGLPPSGSAWLGTDYLGRDVLSRVMWGGVSVLVLGTTATLVAFIVGGAAGLIAGYRSGIVDSMLMRGADVLFAFPALLIILLLATALGTSLAVLVVGVVLVQIAGIARVVRSATVEVATRDFVEASVLRGERTSSILVRDVLPNASAMIMADFGVRFAYSIILIASLSFLGLGLQAPAADWGLMISENRPFITTNPWSVAVPAALIGLLTVGVNLVGDTYVRSLDRSRLTGRAAPAARRNRDGSAQGVEGRDDRLAEGIAPR
jgi:peptide/nickel transport system permease protein